MTDRRPEYLASLLQAEDFLIRACAGQEPLLFLNAALAAIGAVAVAVDVPTEFPHEAARLAELVSESVPEVARAVAGEIPSSEVDLAMAAAARLLSEDQTDRATDLLVVGLLKLELTRLVLRSQLRSQSKLQAGALTAISKTKPVFVDTTWKN